MFLALGPAGVADLGTQPADRGGEARAAAHESGRLPADAGAVPVQADALRQLGDLAFSRAGIGAVVTFLRAAHASLDAALVLLVSHERPPSGKGTGENPADR